MMATIVMYINSVLGLISGLVFAVPVGTILVLGQVAAALGIANEKKWGYWLGVVVVALWLPFILINFTFVSLFSLLFAGALLALLLHPQSRNYRRTWFR
jgi:uncharacterized membrane protein (DUF2068 family)